MLSSVALLFFRSKNRSKKWSKNIAVKPSSVLLIVVLNENKNKFPSKNLERKILIVFAANYYYYIDSNKLKSGDVK